MARKMPAKCKTLKMAEKPDLGLVPFGSWSIRLYFVLEAYSVK